MSLSYPNILLDALEVGVIILDEEFNVLYWNKWLEINTTVPAGEIMGKNLQDFYPDIDYKVLSRKIRTTLRINSPTFYDATLHNRFIEIPRTKITTSLLANMQLQVTISPYLIENGMVMISIYDISDLHELKMMLQQRMEEIANLNDELRQDKKIIDSNLMIVKASSECAIIETTEAFRDFFGYTHDEVEGLSLSSLFADQKDETEYLQMKEVLDTKRKWSGEIEIVTKTGTRYWMDAVISPYIDKTENVLSYTAIYHDITDKKRIELLSVTDPLTKLYNRQKFNDVCAQMLMRKHWKEDNTFGLIIVDVDHFKNVNDTYGHQVGDAVLIHVADTLTDTIRTGDILARWGGEEFVILLSDINLEKGCFVAEKLRHAIDEIEIEPVGKITASFGVSVYCEGDTQESLMQRADTALYRAKQNGRNRVEALQP